LRPGREEGSAACGTGRSRAVEKQSQCQCRVAGQFPTRNLAGIRYDSGDRRRSDIDLWYREITGHGKGRKTRTVKVSHDVACALDRYIRVRTRHA
jgi:hypothetical protein